MYVNEHAEEIPIVTRIVVIGIASKCGAIIIFQNTVKYFLFLVD